VDPPSALEAGLVAIHNMNARRLPVEERWPKENAVERFRSEVLVLEGRRLSIPYL